MAFSTEELEAPPGAAGSPGALHARRLTDRIMLAFQQACEQGDLDTAGALLRVLETMMARQAQMEGNRRRNVESLVAAHERLWHLRHPGRDA